MAQDGQDAFGPLLRRHRQAAGLTQEELAERAHVSARAVSDLERGVYRAPRKDTVRLLADALALPADSCAAFAVAARGRRDAPAPDPSVAVGFGRAPGSALPPLVGRADELAALERHLAGEGPPVLLLAGEPGIGKSRLLHEAARRATGYGWTILRGECQRRGGQGVYAPLLDALDGDIRRRTPGDLHRQLAGCAWLGRLLPELVGHVPPLPATGSLTPAQERRLMVKAVARFLGNVAGPVGTLLLLDDLQWAGADALDLLAALVRSAPLAPLRVVGAYRDTDVRPQDPLAATVAELARTDLALQLTLGPLAPREAVDLLDALLAGVESAEPVVRARILQRADAIPFFLVSCARGLHAGAVRAGAADNVPWTLMQGIRQRVVALPESAQATLAAAAVVGRRARRALLIAVATRPAEEVCAGLDLACWAHLLEEDGPDAYCFAHDVIREVVEADLGAARRTALHRRVATVLEDQAAGTGGELPVAILAYHYSRSDASDKAVLYLEWAGDNAQAQHAIAEAEQYYRVAGDHLERLGRRSHAARVCEKLGTVLHTAARYDAALVELERAAGVYQGQGDWESLGRVTAQMGWVHGFRGTPQEGTARVQPLLATLEARGRSPAVAALYIALARLYRLSGQWSEGLAAAERAVDVARTLGDERLLTRAEARRGTALASVGRGEEALQAHEEAIRLASAVGDLEILAHALNNAAGAHLERGELETAGLYYERGIAVTERLANPAEIAFLMAAHSVVALVTGDWSRARTEAEAALALGRSCGAVEPIMEALQQLGVLSLLEGDWGLAVSHLEEYALLARDSGNVAALHEAQQRLAWWALLEGRAANAQAHLIALLERPGAYETAAPWHLALLAEAHLDVGALGEAADTAAWAVTRARDCPDRIALGEALRVQAMVATRQERWAEAQRVLEEGLTLTRSLPHPYAEARLQQTCGLMYVAQGEPAVARERLEAALAIFQRLGARKNTEWAEHAIADLQR